MENFYDDDFERYLKEQADQFKMEPSQKAWHGIYNNFHPGKRWPSIASGLMVVTLLSLTNTLNTRQPHLNTIGSFNNSDIYSEDKLTTKADNSDNISKGDADFDNQMIADLSSLDEANGMDIFHVYGGGKKHPVNLGTLNKETNLGTSASGTNETNSLSNNKNSQQILFNEDGGSSKSTTASFTNAKRSESLPSTLEIEKLQNPVSDEASTTSVASEQPLPKPQFTKSNPLDRSNTLFLSKIMKRHQFSRKWSFFASPTINYRTIGRKTDLNNDNNQLAATGVNAAIQVINVRERTQQHPALGFEAGAKVDFNINDRLKLFTGLQINYSGYNIKATPTHPVMTSLEIVDHGVMKELVSLSFFGNDNAATSTIHSFSLEAMLPLGIEYKLLDHNGISLNVMTAFLPSVVVNERSYLLSADTHYYINNSDMQRSLNINGEAGTFIGFKSGKLKYEIGPEFRYQILSNFRKSLPYSEHLINYGLRFSISH